MWQNTRAYASDVSQQATQSLRETIEQNPLLVAGVGLLLGGVIASALPKWQPEDNLLGNANAAVKRRATQAASAGLETAKGNVEEFLANVARQAEAEGLTSEDLIDAMKDVRNRIQRVAERAERRAALCFVMDLSATVGLPDFSVVRDRAAKVGRAHAANSSFLTDRCLS
jgi:hypothetical protein